MESSEAAFCIRRWTLCRGRHWNHASIPAVPIWQTACTVQSISPCTQTDRLPPSVATEAGGSDSVRRISAGILCVCVAKHRDGSRQRPWLTISFLTVVIRIWCGMKATGRLFASPATTARRGRKTEIPSIDIDYVWNAAGGGIKIPNCEFFTDRRSLSRTKTGIQTPYWPLSEI